MLIWEISRSYGCTSLGTGSAIAEINAVYRRRSRLCTNTATGLLKVTGGVTSFRDTVRERQASWRMLLTLKRGEKRRLCLPGSGPASAACLLVAQAGVNAGPVFNQAPEEPQQIG